MTQDYPAGSDPIVAALVWVEALVLGSFGTSIAILAVAGIGFSLMTGRIAARRAFTVVVGCAVLFGAPAIARALRGLAFSSQAAPVETALAPAEEAKPPVQAPVAMPYDPYPGASVPPR